MMQHSVSIERASQRVYQVHDAKNGGNACEINTPSPFRETAECCGTHRLQTMRIAPLQRVHTCPPAQHSTPHDHAPSTHLHAR